MHHQEISTYGCTLDPEFYPTHIGHWKDYTAEPITPAILNDGAPILPLPLILPSEGAVVVACFRTQILHRRY